MQPWILTRPKKFLVGRLRRVSHAPSRLHHSISHSINPLINFFGLALTRSCFFGSHHVAHTRHIFYEPRAPDSKFFYERSNSHHTRTHPISHSSHRSRLKNLFSFFIHTPHIDRLHRSVTRAPRSKKIFRSRIETTP